MKNTLLALLVVATLGLAGLAWNQRSRIAELEAAQADAAARAARAEKSAQATKQLLAEAEKARAAAPTETKAARSAGGGAQAAGAARRDAANAMAVLDNPGIQKMMSTGMKNSLDQRYASLFRQLKLSPAALDKLKDLLVEKQMSAMDAMRVAQANGMMANPAEMAGVMNKVQGEVDESIHSLLGDQGFQHFQDYNQNMASYALLDQLERRLSFTNVPLEASQAEAMLQVFKTTTQPSQIERTAAGGAMAGFVQSFAGASPIAGAISQRPVTDATIDGARGVLSAPQLEALQQLQVEQQSQMNAMQNLRGAIGGPGAAVGEARVITIPATPQPAPKN